MESVFVCHCEAKHQCQKQCLLILAQEIKIKMSWRSLPVADRIVFCFNSSLLLVLG